MAATCRELGIELLELDFTDGRVEELAVGKVPTVLDIEGAAEVERVEGALPCAIEQMLRAKHARRGAASTATSSHQFGQGLPFDQSASVHAGRRKCQQARQGEP